MSYTVQARVNDGWTLHSTHDSYRDAVDQSDMIHGRVVCQTGMTDHDAWQYAVAEQGYGGDYDSWAAQDDDERAAYEAGANGIGTA